LAPEEICEILKKILPESIEDTVVASGHPHAMVKAEHWREVAAFLRDDPRLQFNMLRSIAAIDLLADDKIACVYDLISVPLEHLGKLITASHEFAVRIEVDRNDPSIPSVADIWPAADWHEREAYDMMGVDFPGHPDPRRILCPDDWEGHPLRKDYEHPLEYHGIPGTTEYELPNPRH
jgi:NADH-quinone oxidoreductase subunit C